MKKRLIKKTQKFLYIILVKFPRFFRNSKFKYLKLNENIKFKIKNYCWRTKRRKQISMVVLAILIIAPIYFFLTANKSAAWWDSNWYYRKSIDLTNNTTTETNVYVNVSIDTSDTTKFQTDCGDLRFTKANGDVLPYMVNLGCGTTATSISVAFDSFDAGKQTIYYYYGNPSAPNGWTSASASGSVVHNNMRLSILAGTAFVDFGTPAVLTQFVSGGNRLVISDTASKKLTGFIKTAGSGNQTDADHLGSEIVQNGGFETGEPPSNWTATYGGVPSRVADPRTGSAGSYSINCLKGTSAGTVTQAATNVSGSLYYYDYWVRNVDAGWGAVLMFSNLCNNTYAYSSSTSWTHLTGFKTTSSANKSIDLYVGDPANGVGNARFDDVSLKQVLVPSATGVTITSTQSGSTYSWKTEEASFDRDSWSGYTYIIYPTNFSTEASNYTVGTIGSEEKSPAPIAYWSFDEGYGSTVHDETSNRRDGTLANSPNAPSWKTDSDCLSGKCLDFDGSNDYLRINDNADWDLAGKTATVSVWFRYTGGVDDTGYIFHHFSGGTPGAGWILAVNTSTNKLIFNHRAPANQITLTSTNAYNDSKWHFAAVTLDGSNSKLYVDGKLDVSDTYADLIDWDGYLSMGGNTDAYSYKGQIDEPKIYNYVRSADQIKKDYNSGLAGMGKAKEGAGASFGDRSDKWMTDGLVGYWKMDESSGTTAPDFSGNGNTGTLTNMLESGTAAASSDTLNIIPGNTAPFSTADDAYNGMIVTVTGGVGCGVTANTQRVISDYTGSSGTVTVSPAFASETDNCNFQIIHQVGGKFGNGESFDGTDDYLSIGNTAISSGALSSGSISYWIKPESVTTMHPFMLGTNRGSCGSFSLAQYYSGSSGTKLYTYFSNGSYNGSDCNKGPAKLSSKTFNLNQWNHIVTVWDSKHQALYVNGELDWERQIDSSGLLANQQLMIGKNIVSGTNNVTKGGIDEFRFYNRALSPDEVQKLYNWAPGPVGYWNMDEGVGGTAADLSGSGNQGNLASGNSAPSWVNGKYGKALNFDGSNDYVQVGNITQYKNVDKAISFWANPSASVTSTIPLFSASNANYYAGFSNQDRMIFSYTNAAGTQKTVTTDSNSVVKTNEWHFYSYAVQVSGDNVTVKLYKDGILTKEQTNTDGYGTSVYGNNFLIGSFTSSSSFFAGKIDDVRLYNYARTPGQIIEDMQNGSRDPLAYYKFDEGIGSTAYNSGLGCADASQCVSTRGILGAGSSSPTWTNDGKFGKALSFDGNDYINVGGTIPQAASFSFWAKPSSTSQYILDLDNGTHYIRINSGTLLGVGMSSPVYYIDGKQTSTFPDTNWHHVVVSTSSAFDASKITIGKQSTNFYSGILDEVKIYNFQVTSDDVKADYDHGVSAQMGSLGVGNTATSGNAASQEYCVPGSADTCSAPVGEWKMNEKVSGDSKTIYDTSGNGYNGTTHYGANATGMNCSVPGKFGSGCQFDGVDDYIASSDIDMPAGEATTISAWIKYSAAQQPGNNNDGYIVSKNQYQSSSPYQLYVDSNNKLDFSASSDLNASSLKVHNDGNWHFAAGVRNGNNVYLYVDGVLVGSDTSGTGVANNNDLVTIGGDDASSTYRPFLGQIDQVRIYNYVRTASQIAWEYNRGKAVAEWKFDECSGSTVHDGTLNANNGTIHLGTTAPQTDAIGIGSCTESAQTPWYNGRSGKYGASLNFDGQDDYIDAGTGATLGVGATANITISAWIKPASVGGTQYVVAKGKSLTSWGYFLRLSGQYQAGNSSGGTGLGFSPTQGVWQHVIVVYKSDGTATGYLNGVGYTPIAKGTSADTQKLYIGAGQNTDGTALSPFNGQIDDVKIFNYALTGEQVKQVYNNSSAVQFSP